MAITIDYLTNIINVPKADTQFVETNINTGLEVRELNIDTFGKALADVQDDAGGVWAPTAYSYTAPAAIGGIQLAPVLLILSPYTITFEDGQYAVNLIGGNTNMQDFVNVNQVSIRPNNSAGNTFSSAILEIRTEIDSNSTELAAIKSKTDLIPADPAGISDIPTATENADEVWNKTLP